MMSKRGRERRYQPPAVNARQHAREQKEGTRTLFNLPEGMDLFSIAKEGVYRFDIIPYIVTRPRGAIREGTLHYERTYYAHFGISVDNRAFICPRMFNKPCPICEEFEKLRKDPDTEYDSIKSLRPRERQLFLVIDVKNRNKGVQLLDMATFNFGAGIVDRINECEIDEDAPDYSVFANLEDGLTVTAHFTANTIKTKDGSYTFLKCEKPDFFPREVQYDESILDDLPKLDEIFVLKPYNVIAAAFFGTGEEVEEQEEEDSAPLPTKRRAFEDAPKAHKASAPKLVVEDEEEEEEEEEEDLPILPPRKQTTEKPLPKKTKVAALVEEEETPLPRKYKEPVQEDDTEEPPVKDKKTATNRCPYNHVFKKDGGIYDECEECDLFDECNRP